MKIILNALRKRKFNKARAILFDSTSPRELDKVWFKIDREFGLTQKQMNDLADVYCMCRGKLNGSSTSDKAHLRILQ
jgi:hypothetical protein